MGIRIAIEGVPSTGKTTLARQVSEQTGLPWLEEQKVLDAGLEFASGVLGRKLTHIPSLTDEEVLYFETGLLTARMTFADSMESHITDNGPITNLNHLYVLFYKSMPEKQFNIWRDWIVSEMGTYDMIYYLPFGLFPVEDDGRRHTDQRYLEMMNYHMRGIMDECDSLPIVELWEKNLDRRVEALVKDYEQLNRLTNQITEWLR